MNINKQQILLIIVITILGGSNAYTTSTSCVSCLKAKTSNKWCMMSFDSTSGYCCDKDNTSDYCTSSRYMCTDKALTPAMKYNFCPFSQTYCSNSA